MAAAVAPCRAAAACMRQGRISGARAIAPQPSACSGRFAATLAESLGRGSTTAPSAPLVGPAHRSTRSRMPRSRRAACLGHPTPPAVAGPRLPCLQDPSPTMQRSLLLAALLLAGAWSAGGSGRAWWAPARPPAARARARTAGEGRAAAPPAPANQRRPAADLRPLPAPSRLRPRRLADQATAVTDPLPFPCAAPAPCVRSRPGVRPRHLRGPRLRVRLHQGARRPHRRRHPAVCAHHPRRLHQPAAGERALRCLPLGCLLVRCHLSPMTAPSASCRQKHCPATRLQAGIRPCPSRPPSRLQAHVPACVRHAPTASRAPRRPPRPPLPPQNRVVRAVTDGFKVGGGRRARAWGPRLGRRGAAGSRERFPGLSCRSA